MFIRQHTFDASKIEGQALHLNTSYAQFGETLAWLHLNQTQPLKAFIISLNLILTAPFTRRSQASLITNYFILRSYYTHEKNILWHIAVLQFFLACTE